MNTRKDPCKIKRQAILNYETPERRVPMPLARLWARLCLLISIGSFAITFVMNACSPLIRRLHLSSTSETLLMSMYLIFFYVSPVASLAFGIMAIIQAPRGLRVDIIRTALMGMLLGALWLLFLVHPMR